MATALLERTGAAANRRREPYRAISPDWLARGSASPLSACIYSASESLIESASLTHTHFFHIAVLRSVLIYFEHVFVNFAYRMFVCMQAVVENLLRDYEHRSGSIVSLSADQEEALTTDISSPQALQAGIDIFENLKADTVNSGPRPGSSWIQSQCKWKACVVVPWGT